MFGLCLEASHQRGLGHLYRMLSLSQALAERGMSFYFFINADVTAEASLQARGLSFDIVDLTAADWQQAAIERHGIRVWVDDRLDTDLAHAERVRASGIRRVTFDDRGAGALPADLNVAALAFDPAEVLPGHRVLRGPRYLVLNPAIARYRHARYAAASTVVSMGGSDTYGATVKVVRLLRAAGRGATVIVGPSFRHEDELASVLDDGFVLKRGVPSLAEEFSRHDLAVTGGGVTPFEANAAGLPCVVIANEDFEIPVGQGLAALGGAVFAGHHTAIDAGCLSRPLPIAAMSEAALRSIDLDGASRVLDAIGALA